MENFLFSLSAPKAHPGLSLPQSSFPSRFQPGLLPHPLRTAQQGSPAAARPLSLFPRSPADSQAIAQSTPGPAPSFPAWPSSVARRPLPRPAQPEAAALRRSPPCLTDRPTPLVSSAFYPCSSSKRTRTEAVSAPSTSPSVAVPVKLDGP